MKSWRDEGGAALVEWALVLPVLLVLLAAILGAGRLWSVKAGLLAVAKEAARTAVEQPDEATAARAAVEAAQDEATGYGLDASRLQVEPQGPFLPGGTYRVTVRYDVSLEDLPALGLLPASHSLEASFAEPIDPHASR